MIHTCGDLLTVDLWTWPFDLDLIGHPGTSPYDVVEKVGGSIAPVKVDPGQIVPHSSVAQAVLLAAVDVGDVDRDVILSGGDWDILLRGNLVRKNTDLCNIHAGIGYRIKGNDTSTPPTPHDECNIFGQDIYLNYKIQLYSITNKPKIQPPLVEGVGSESICEEEGVGV